MLIDFLIGQAVPFTLGLLLSSSDRTSYGRLIQSSSNIWKCLGLDSL